jgi:cytoskeletal protein CcmA (bactofilin family)
MKTKFSINKLVAQMSFIAVLFIVGLAFAQTTHAMVVRAGESYTLDSYATLEDDLYVVGENVTSAGTTTGDFLALGSYVEQSGVVSDDVFILGGNVVVTGTVGGDLRIVGGKVYLNGHVTEDVVLAGGTVTIGKDAVIDGDLFVMADYLVLEGTVHGLVEMKARVAELQGTIGKDVRAGVWEALSLTKNAVVEGSLTYHAPREAFISETASVKGNVEFVQVDRTASEKSIDLYGLLFYILLTVVGAVAFALFFPSQARTMTTKALSDGSGMRMLKGFFLFIAWPLASLLLIVTILGAIPGIILLGTFGTVFFVAMAFTPVLAGVFLARWMKKEKDELSPLWASLGAVSITLIAYLPVFGWIIRFLILLLAFYTVSHMLYEGVWVTRKKGVTEMAKKNKDHDTEKEPEQKKD